MKVKSLSRVRLLATTWTAAHQAPLSMGFPGKSTGVGCHHLLQGLRFRKLQRKNARGCGLQPKVGWDGWGPYAQRFKYLRPPCRGSSSETPPGWALSAPGICEEGSRELAPCAESETGSQCVGSHNASSGLVLVLRMGSFRERTLWPLKDL